MDELITIPETPMSLPEMRLRYRSLVGWSPFDFREGWYPLAQGALQAIEDALIAAGKEPQDFPKVQSLREKYGMLRIGIDCPELPLIQDILREAEDCSMETCVFCGGRGAMRYYYEYERPSCDPCERKFQAGDIR